MKKIILNGTILSGVGGGQYYLNLPGVKQQIREKLGFEPYPGTLNVRLSEESAEKRQELQHDAEHLIRPQVRSYPGILIKAKIGPQECAIIHPEDPNYPQNIVEIIAPINLRRELKLSDGSEVTIVAYAT